MLDGMVRLLPSAEVGFLGMIRNEETLEVSTYANRLPDDLTGRQVFVLDPMLATGGTLVMAIDYLIDQAARDDITAVCLLAAPEGIQHLEDAARRQRHPGQGRASAPSTSGSTRRATSSRASATPATASTASSEPTPCCVCRGLRAACRPTRRLAPVGNAPPPSSR